MNLRNKLFTLLVLMVLCASPLMVVDLQESDAATTDWKCTVTISDSTITTKYEKGGATLADTTPVNGISQTVGSWGFDKNGYGPFNSFYAAFDPATGKMVCHLNPDNLKQAMDGTDISGKGYNIMWCLPKIYVSVSGSTLTMSSDSADGTLAPAFTVGGTSYNYLAIGVYEATLNGTVLGSESGTSPKDSTSLADFRTYSKNAKVEGGVTLLWNYHMYELYRMCSLAVMENFDSQAQVGYGNANASASSTTGQTDGYGPYFGTSSASTTGVKLFIENAWGSLWEYVDDAWWSDGLYAGQNLNPTSDTANKTKTTVTSGLDGYGTYPYSTELDSWGLPTSTSFSNSSTAPDYLYSSSSNDALIVGNTYWYGRDAAGLSCLHRSVVGGSNYFGSRLTYLFADDSAAIHTVTLDHSNLTTAGGNATGFDTELTITDTATYPDLNTVTSNPSIQAGWTHIGWEVDGKEYKIGASLASTKSHTAKSLWAEPMITMDHSALSSLGGPVTDLPSTKKIVDATTTYPDLNSAEYAFYELGFRHTGWYDEEGNFYDIGSPVIQTTSHTVKSAWIVPQITITFMVEGKVHSTLQVPKGSVGVVYTPVMVEGVFEGWYYDAEYTKKYRADKALDGPTTLYAKGVPPLVFTSEPNAAANIQQVNSYGMFFFDATDSSGRYQIHWDFGDGNTSDEAIAYNTYSEPGLYTVTLTVTNIYGESATSTYEIDLRDGSATNDVKWFAIGALCVIVAGFVVRRIL